MEKYDLTPAERRQVDVMVGMFSLVAAVEGTENAAQFIVDTLIDSDQMLEEVADHTFLFDNGIVPESM